MHRQRSHLEEWASLLDERVSEEALDEGIQPDSGTDWSEPRQRG
ncbi:hypothetical protein ACFQMA_13720 [Halosimplex aquaticum]|uniref:Uncharacterized protein n=1 Tax=Halosimplex aquaticum TaxID=3026162 RepID=A0ABD5Y0F1_9EURY|nr:hypothetical protein [Halosimplex aquaticum]